MRMMFFGQWESWWFIHSRFEDSNQEQLDLLGTQTKTMDMIYP